MNKAKIVIVDYGMGNLHSVRKAFEVSGGNAVATRDVKAIEDADALVVPGVGSFGECVDNLDRFRLMDPIKTFIGSGRPYLGLCLGLQILFPSSEESPGKPGLGLLKGGVRKFKGDVKIPHIGWNTISLTGEGRRCPLFNGLDSGTYVYFVHSYYACPDAGAAVAAETRYGVNFASAVWTENIIATQFHPEKSQRVGLRMIRNFIETLR